MKIIIAGGTGFVGSAVVEQLLSERHEVAVLSRRSSQEMSARNPKAVIVAWNGETLGEWCSVIDGADAVINLSGENRLSNFQVA